MKTKKGNKDNIVDLIDAIEKAKPRFRPKSLDLSFNELLDMYKNKELDINPNNQRLFKWSKNARSRFIESLLLGMSIPPFYVLEKQDGKYLLIDGLQRISSYLHFRGELDIQYINPKIKQKCLSTGDFIDLFDEGITKKETKLKLNGCNIIKELNGRTFDDLGTALQIRIKRTFIRIEIVPNEGRWFGLWRI